MQRIVGMLVFRSAKLFPIHDVSPWLSARFHQPIEVVVATAEAQTHRPLAQESSAA